MTTQAIEIKGKLTKKQCDTITAAAEWIERISNRKDELPKLFMNNLDPAPIGKKLRQMVKENGQGDSVKSTDLLACPFCGGEPKHSPEMQGPIEHGPGAYRPETVQCKTCQIIFRRGENGVSDPVRKWQTRSGIPFQG